MRYFEGCLQSCKRWVVGNQHNNNTHQNLGASNTTLSKDSSEDEVDHLDAAGVGLTSSAPSDNTESIWQQRLDKVKAVYNKELISNISRAKKVFAEPSGHPLAIEAPEYFLELLEANRTIDATSDHVISHSIDQAQLRVSYLELVSGLSSMINRISDAPCEGEEIKIKEEIIRILTNVLTGNSKAKERGNV